MLKREIKFTTFDDEPVEVSETHYFHISETELVELEASIDGGLSKWLQKLIESGDNKTIFSEFKRIILLSYGEKSADGRSFVKNDEIRARFEQTAAFNSLFLDLMTKDGEVTKFLDGVLPKQFLEDMSKDAAKAKGTPPPPPAR